MRITIEVDQEVKSVQTIATQERSFTIPASDAGSPPERLLAEIGAASEAAASIQSINTGPPPAWLIEVIEAFAKSKPRSGEVTENDEGTALDGGKAPEAA